MKRFGAKIVIVLMFQLLLSAQKQRESQNGKSTLQDRKRGSLSQTNSAQDTSPTQGENLSQAEQLELEAIQIGTLARRATLDRVAMRRSYSKSKILLESLASLTGLPNLVARDPDTFALKMQFVRASAAMENLSRCIDLPVPELKAAALAYSDSGAILGSMVKSMGDEANAAALLAEYADQCRGSGELGRLIMMANASGNARQAKELLDACVFSQLTRKGNQAAFRLVERALPNEMRRLIAANERSLAR